MKDEKLIQEQIKIQELKINTIIFAIATLSSKAISFVLAPLYSYHLSISEFGVMDIVLTTVSLLVPIVVFDVYEGVFRFASDKKENHIEVFTNSIVLGIIGSLLSLIFFVPFAMLYGEIKIVGMIFLYVVLDGFSYILSWYARGIGKVKCFAFAGVLSTFLQLVFTIIFIVTLKMGLNGWYIGMLFSRIICIIYLLLQVDIKASFDKKLLNFDYQKKVLKYSIPLIPSGIMWWVTNVSDRYVIGLFLGTAANGIYATANKIPAILSMVENVFYKAFQTSAINSKEDVKRNNFYSDVFNAYLAVLLLSYTGILIVAKPIIEYLFASSYYDAWLYIPVLLMGIVVHAIDGNLGTYYTVFYNTKGALKTSVWGAVVNIVLNLLLIPRYGLIMAAITTLIGYIVIFVLRWCDVKKYVQIKVDYKRNLFMIMVVLVQSVLYFVPSVTRYLYMFILAFISLIYNKNLLLKLVKNK